VRLNQIRDLVAVIESGSIRAAARKLQLSQPAITKSVRGLEAELHLELLKRTPRGIVPTPAGRALLVRARAIQAELRKADEEMSQLAGTDAGSVSFGVGPLAASLVVPEAIRQFREHFGQSRVRIVEGFAPALIAKVRDESLDFALGPRFDTAPDAALAFRPLFREQFAVVVRRGHPLARARSLAELADCEWLRVEGSGWPGGWLDRTFNSVGRAVPCPLVHCDSLNVLVAAISRTDMVGMLGTRMLEIAWINERLARVPIREALPMATIGMFTRVDPPLTRVAAAMAKTVTSVARRLAQSN
jgi:LysR family transcriptional regulator, regulator of abg operon